MAIHASESGMMASVREVPEQQLRDWASARDATQFFATQVSLAFVVEEYLNNKEVRSSMQELIKIPAEYSEGDDGFSLNVDSAIGEGDDARRDQLLDYDLGPQMIHIAAEFITRNSEHTSSVFTQGLYQGERFGTLEQILAGLKDTIAFVEEHWPRNVVDIVRRHTIGDYEAANAFLTPSGYLEALRGRKKINPGLKKKHLGTIAFGVFMSSPPIAAALTRQIKYMSPIYMILSSLESSMAQMGIVDETTVREFESLKDGLLESAAKIDQFIQDKVAS